MKREFWPPCQVACPISTDVQGYVSLAALGKFSNAFDVARLTNPFVNSCGYICFHPCEDKCRRAAVDQAVSIMALKRATSEHGKKASTPHAQNKMSTIKVAVIGAGPAGLTAAQDLQVAGFKVTVFERGTSAGGMLSLGIPKYRLPREALSADIKAIQAAGVKIELNKELGRNLDLGKLKKDGFAVIILATGLPLSRSLPVFPSPGGGVLLALPFLQAVNEDKKVKMGRHVIVVGGGNVAIDCARSAMRLGAEKVKVVCVEDHEQMPAHEWEIEEAAEEGIEFNCCLGPKHLLTDDNKVSGLTCLAVRSVFDETGRFNPTFFEDKSTDITGDTIIVAIGQMVDTAPFGEQLADIRMGKVKGVFIAGEMKEGPGSAVEAVMSGHQAAVEAADYLKASMVMPSAAPSLAELPDKTIERIEKKERITRMVRSAAERRKDFAIFEAGYTKFEASKEALRCLACGSGAVVDGKRCVACLTCVRVCPYEVPKIGMENVAEVDPIECQACGICITECPALAISFSRDQEERILKEIEAAVERSKDVEFYCQNRLFYENGSAKTSSPVRVSCLAHVSTRAILHALSAGAESVLLSPCAEGHCIHTDGRKWAMTRAAEVRHILLGLGRDAETIKVEGEE